NARLQADILATAARIEASRRRLLAVADTERRQLEAELQSGARARLDHVEALLADGTDRHGLRDQVRICHDAVRDFARGIHPRALTERGLSVALVELTAGSPVPVELDVRTGRCREEVEVAAYY